MADINLTCITPLQLSGGGEAGPFPIGTFEQRYLAQGDSWFAFGAIPPWSTSNLLLQTTLSRPSVVVDCARPGTELSHMTDTSTNREFLNLLNGNVAWRWDAILMSGGGNDIIDVSQVPPTADKSLRILLASNEWLAASNGPTRYFSAEGWNTFAAHMESVLNLLLQQRDKKINADVPLLLHTYDYVTPRNAGAKFLGFPVVGPWLYRAMNDIYKIPSQDWNALADLLIDQLANLWIGLGQKYATKKVQIVDTRNTLVRAQAGTTGNSNDWENEIHPNPNGYVKLADVWRKQLDLIPDH
jgi:lysophospholipase L1-like esterase